MGSYGKILRGTGRYLELAFKPLLYVIVPITLLMVQMDRYLGATPLAPDVPFLLTVQLTGQSAGATTRQSTGSDALSDVTLYLSPEIKMTGPLVHVPAGNENVLRPVGARAG